MGMVTVADLDTEMKKVCRTCSNVMGSNCCLFSVCLSPVLVKKLDDDGTIIHAISSGGNHIVAVDRDGIVFSWGYNNCGQLGIGSLETVHGCTHCITLL